MAETMLNFVKHQDVRAMPVWCNTFSTIASGVWPPGCRDLLYQHAPVLVERYWRENLTEYPILRQIRGLRPAPDSQLPAAQRAGGHASSSKLC